MKSTIQNVSPIKQGGAVLFISLILLVVMTLIGITGMHTTILEEKMSRNFRDKNIAFQTAESALKSADNQLQNNLLVNFGGATPGLYTPSTGVLPPRWETVDWANPVEVIADPVAYGNVAQQPAYIIEKLPAGHNTRLNMGGSLVKIHSYRLTARGTGSSTNSPVMLQTVFNKFE